MSLRNSHRTGFQHFAGETATMNSISQFCLSTIALTFALSCLKIHCEIMRHVIYKKLPIAAKEPVSAFVIKEVHRRRETFCMIECSKEETCKAVINVQESQGNWTCVLLNNVAKCPKEAPDPNLHYYQNDMLSNLKIRAKASRSGPDTALAPDEIWRADCLSDHCKHSALIGVRDLANATNADLDHILCGSYGGDLEFDLQSSVTASIRSPTPQQCPPNMVVTALWDSLSYFGRPKQMKCSSIKHGWKVDYNKCETQRIKREYERLCNEIDQKPTFIVGLHCGSNSLALETMKCCAVFK